MTELAKIVVTGPFSAGKSTLIRTISEIAVLSTEQPVSGDSRPHKTQTTVALDFGRITLAPDLVLLLFGTPGQTRFDFMWEILSQGVLGYVLLIDSTEPTSLPEAAEILAAFRRLADVPFVVALNRAAEVAPEYKALVREQLDLADAVPVVACEATDRESVKAVLLTLLTAVAARLERALAVPA